MKVTIEKRSKRRQNLMMLILGTLLVVAVINLNDNLSNKSFNNLNVMLYSTNMPIKVGNSTTLQVLVYDEIEGAINDAKLSISLMEGYKIAEPVKKKLLFVENGLYETEVRFLKTGSWEAVIEVRVGKHHQEKKLPLYVKAY